ncbi:F-type H+-transporting ATPase subunit delta [Amphibacillus marinus]|uniref:ATP synthase subunit delta n=1 Tax=Amphibacillus marinus TaxID=872970 RepID=A0A1H8N1V1_9BACI|nr:ATP synthase F1 subunit delta [Amphibacillus marinus]SEO23587.1 F-type H+-transporting ATPase subunit delta [Amphibacillus marinus]
MKNRLKARRYAEALYEVASERGHCDLIEAELMVIKEVFYAKSELVSFLQNPQQWMNRARIIKSTFTTFSSEVVKTLLIMVEHHAEKEVGSMVDYYVTLLNRDRCIGVGKVLTAEPLAEERLEEISVRFAPKFNFKRLKLINVIEPDILGGFKIIVNQQVYDASVQGRLRNMKKNFVPLYKR